MIGVRPNNDGTSLKIGVTIQQKSVVHIDNLILIALKHCYKIIYWQLTFQS